MTLEFENDPTLWALVKGNAIPPFFVSPWNFLLDSNAVTKLQNRDKLLPPERDWWDQMLDAQDTVLNPVPNAFEGNNGMVPPTREEFEQRFLEDVTMLRSEFPNVHVIEYNDFAFDGVYQMVADVASGNAAENNFLVATAPLIQEGVRQSDRRSVEQQILQTANALGLRADSFSLYSTLSCLYSSAAEKQIARKILKPKQIIANGNAYNALTDLSLLRLFTATLAYFGTTETPAFALLTADKGLINFWRAIGLHDFRVNDAGHAEATFMFSGPMFPNLSEDERHELSLRVAAL